MREIFYIRLPSGVPVDDMASAVVDYGISAADQAGIVEASRAPLSQALDHVGISAEMLKNLSLFTTIR